MADPLLLRIVSPRWQQDCDDRLRGVAGAANGFQVYRFGFAWAILNSYGESDFLDALQPPSGCFFAKDTSSEGVLCHAMLLTRYRLCVK